MPAATPSARRPQPKTRPIQGVNGEGDKESFRLIPLDQLQPNPHQPRRVLDDTKDDEGLTSLERLAQSIREEGILQPLLVTPAGRDGKFTVVCGERRLRAARLCHLKVIPCILRKGLSETAMLELGLTENLHRQDLSPVDEARAIQGLIQKCGYTQRQVAKRLGLSDAAVNYKLSLLKLSPDLQKDLAKGDLTATQGRAITQEVSRIQGPDALRKRTTAMQVLHKDLAHGNGRIDTLQTRTLARDAVQRVQGNGHAANGAAAPKRAAISKAEKEQADAFLDTLKTVRKTLQPFEEATGDKGRLDRLVQALLDAHKKPGTLIERSAEVMQRVHSALRQKSMTSGR